MYRVKIEKNYWSMTALSVLRYHFPTGSDVPGTQQKIYIFSYFNQIWLIRWSFGCRLFAGVFSDTNVNENSS